MRKTVILLALSALLAPLSAFAATAAGTVDKPVTVVSTGSLASPLTRVEPSFDMESLFQVSSKVERPSSVILWGVCSISCTPCYGPNSCARGDGYCANVCN